MNLRERLAIWLGKETARHLRALREGEETQRLAAARALRTLPLSPRDVRALADALDDPSPFVRWEVADTLAALGTKAALAACMQRARQSDPAAGTAAAIRGLGLTRDPRALDAILSQVDHPDPEVRVAVADALAAFADEQAAREALLRLLADEHAVVRRAAAWAVRRVEDPWAREVLAARATQEPEPWLRQVMTVTGP